MLAFLGVAALMIVTPGPDTALTVRNAVAGGRRAGVATAAGVVTGQAVWTLAAATGLAALLVASEPAFLALRLLGAAYLVALGLQALVAAVRRRPHEPELTTAPSRTPRAAFRQGLLNDLGNPKIAVFFTSLLPQFAPHTSAAFPVLVALGLVFGVMTFAWLAAYSAVVERAGDLLRRGPARRALDAVTGTVLVALGLRLAAEQR